MIEKMLENFQKKLQKLNKKIDALLAKLAGEDLPVIELDEKGEEKNEM